MLIAYPVDYLQVNAISQLIIGIYLHEFTNNEREISIPHPAKPRAVIKISTSPRLNQDNDVRRLLCHNTVSRGTNQPIRKSEFLQCMKVE